MEKKSSPTIKGADLTPLFFPKTVAHVGASPKPAPGRFNFTDFLIKLKYQGRNCPVNPNYKEVFGLTCYPNLSAVPGDIDLAILAVPANKCAAAFQDVPAGKIKFVVVHTSGFSELEDGESIETIVAIGREKGFRVIGPNCMGVYSQQGRVGFYGNHKDVIDHPSTVGVISQSGGIAINIIGSGVDIGLTFDKVLSLGNQSDLSINEVLEYLGHDESIGVIGIYVEDIRDGRRFLSLLKEITTKKPVVVWKGGVSPEGQAAARSHTGSLAGDGKIYAAALRQAGALYAASYEQFLRLLRLLQPHFSLPDSRLAVFSPGGGNTVSTADIFTQMPPLKLPRLTPETKAQIQAILPKENVDLKNPIDPGATGLLQLPKLLNLVGNDPEIHTILLMLAVDYFSDLDKDSRSGFTEQLTNLVVNSSQAIGKPIYIFLRQMRDNNETFYAYRKLVIDKLVEKKIPWLEGGYIEVAEILSKLAAYRLYRENHNV